MRLVCRVSPVRPVSTTNTSASGIVTVARKAGFLLHAARKSGHKIKGSARQITRHVYYHTPPMKDYQTRIVIITLSAVSRVSVCGCRLQVCITTWGVWRVSHGHLPGRGGAMIDATELHHVTCRTSGEARGRELFSFTFSTQLCGSATAT